MKNEAKKSFFIGVDIGGTNIKIGLVTNDGKIISERTIKTEVRKDIYSVLDQISEVIRELIETAGKDKMVQGVGIGMPGQVNVDKGIFHEGPNLPGWRNVKIVSEMEKRLGMPACLDNDAHLAALAEFSFGAGQGVQEMMMVTLGTGVGGGFILCGKIYRGARNSAGEFGHISIQQDGPLCGCGRRGCVEAFVGINGILRRIREKLDSGNDSTLKSIHPDQLTPRDLSIAAEQGDHLAAEVLYETGDYLGTGLANVVNLLNLERIVVGGGVANAGELILEPARKRLAKDALKTPREIVQLVPATLGNQAGIIGAARLAMLNLRSK